MKKYVFAAALIGVLSQTAMADVKSAFGVIVNRASDDMIVSECADEACQSVRLKLVYSNQERSPRDLGVVDRAIPQDLQKVFRANARVLQYPLMQFEDINAYFKDIQKDGTISTGMMEDSSIPMVVKLPLNVIMSSVELIGFTAIAVESSLIAGGTWLWHHGPKEAGLLIASRKAEKAIHSLVGSSTVGTYRFSNKNFNAILMALD